MYSVHQCILLFDSNLSVNASLNGVPWQCQAQTYPLTQLRLFGQTRSSILSVNNYKDVRLVLWNLKKSKLFTPTTHTL